jgi:hypothetical protein
VLALAALCLATAASAGAPPVTQPPEKTEAAETPILVPSPIPNGFLVAWKPTFLAISIDSGTGSKFGSEKFSPLRFLFRYTTHLLHENLFARAEIEGGEFQTDTQGTAIGTDGYDVTARLLGGTATRITPGFIITAGAGFITRYQNGRAESGAPSIGVFGVTSNVELEYRIAPLVTISGYFEGALTPFPYAAQSDLGILSDASEFRFRLQLSLDIGTDTAIDIGYDFTRWHSSFSQSNILNPGTNPDKALLVEDREHAITIGIRWKP